MDDEDVADPMIEAYANALREAIRRSGMTDAAVAREAIKLGAGNKFDRGVLFTHTKGTVRRPDVRAVWALELVLNCDGELTRPLGYLPASQRGLSLGSAAAKKAAQEVVDEIGRQSTGEPRPAARGRRRGRRES